MLMSYFISLFITIWKLSVKHLSLNKNCAALALDAAVDSFAKSTIFNLLCFE